MPIYDEKCEPKVHNICTQKLKFQLYYTIVWWVWLVTRQTMIKLTLFPEPRGEFCSRSKMMIESTPWCCVCIPKILKKKATAKKNKCENLDDKIKPKIFKTKNMKIKCLVDIPLPNHYHCLSYYIHDWHILDIFL